MTLSWRAAPAVSCTRNQGGCDSSAAGTLPGARGGAQLPLRFGEGASSQRRTKVDQGPSRPLTSNLIHAVRSHTA